MIATQNDQTKASVSSFANKIALNTNANSILHYASSDFEAFSGAVDAKMLLVTNSQEIPKGRVYDLILYDIPFGHGQANCKVNNTLIKAPQNWIDIAKSLMLLSPSGIALALMEPLAFANPKGVEFEKALNSLGYFVNGIFNCPEKFLHPFTSLKPVIVALSKKRTSSLYIAELLTKEQAEEVADNFFSILDSDLLALGTFIDKTEYHGFYRLKVRQQIKRLETQYKTFEMHRLSDLANEINTVKSGDTFQEKKNAIYIPSIGSSPVVNHIKDAKLKHQNYFQVILKEETVSKYLVAFFKSTLGRMILDSTISQSYIPRVYKRDLEEIIVPLPSNAEQESIVITSEKLQELKNTLQVFDEQLALNPTRSKTVLEQLDLMLDAINSLTSADRVRALVREGETKTIEFKETLSLDVKKQTKERYIEDEVFKTIVAFLNSNGGTLLIGVRDADGAILGITTEVQKLYKNIDKFLLHFKNLLKSRIGESYYPFWETNIVEVNENPVVVIDCKPSKKECYLDGKDFYVRTNPATDKLEGPKLVEYVKNHFSS